MRGKGFRRRLLVFIALAVTASALLIIPGRSRVSGALARLTGETSVPTPALQAPEATPPALGPSPSAAPTAGGILPEVAWAATAPISTRAPNPTAAATAGVTTPAPATATPTPAAAADAQAETPAPTATRQAHAYYVDSVHGSDSDSGLAPDAAWQTMQALNAMRFGPGDVINLARGSAWIGGGPQTSVLTIDGGGAPGNPITVQAYGSYGDPPRFTNRASIATKANAAYGIAIQAAYVTVQNLLFDDVGEAGIVIYGSYSLIQDNEFTQAGADVEVRAQHSLITRNYMHDNHLAAFDAEDIDNLWGGDGVMVNGASDVEVSYNNFVNCSGPMSIPPYESGAPVEFFSSNSKVFIHHNYAVNSHEFSELGSHGGTDSNITWAYNVEINNGAVVGLHVGGTFITTFHGLLVANNTIVVTNNAHSPYFFYKDGGNGTGFTAGDLVVRNNIFYAHGTDMALDQNPEIPFTHDHNIYHGLSYLNVNLDVSEKDADPRFVDLRRSDYHLQAGSPAINSALATALSSTDFDGCPVLDGGLDIGAYAYGGGTAPASRSCAYQAAARLGVAGGPGGGP